ncbi:unnamed protein product [Urochloa humidicola]
MASVAAAAEHAGDAESQRGRVQMMHPSPSSELLPLLVFDSYKLGMHMFSVSSKSPLNNLERCYGHLRRPGNVYWATPQGWMLLMEYPSPNQGDGANSSSTAAYLWNPRTGGKLPLPNIQDHYDTVSLPTSKCLLTHSDPTHPDCFVVILLLFKNGIIAPHMWFCRISCGGWRNYAYEMPNHRFISVVTACRGKLYFKNTAGSMGTIDFSPTLADSGLLPVIQYFDVGEIRFPHGMGSANRWLVESHDQLFLVYMFFHDSSNSIGAIHAYKMDFEARAWRRVHDIGDLVVFIKGTNEATSCAATPVGLKGNQIYFIKRVKDDDAYLCTFDLEVDTMEKQVLPYNILFHYCTPFWIVPPHSS